MRHSWEEGIWGGPWEPDGGGRGGGMGSIDRGTATTRDARAPACGRLSKIFVSASLMQRRAPESAPGIPRGEDLMDGRGCFMGT